MRTEEGEGNGRFLVLFAAMLWGTTGTAQALAPPTASPAAIGAVRLALGGVALLLLAGRRGFLRRGGTWPLWPVLIAAGCMALYQLSFFAGVARTGVAIGTIVGIGSAPILAGLLAFVVEHERPEPAWWVATTLAVVGCGLLLQGGGADVRVDGAGVLLALGAGGAYAAYTLASKRLLRYQPPEAVTALVFSLGALLLLPLLFTVDLSWLRQPRGFLVALHLGLVTVTVAYLLFVRGLLSVPAATAVTLTLAEPLTAGMLGVFLLGERLPWSALGGVGLLLAGLAWLTAVPRRRAM